MVSCPLCPGVLCVRCVRVTFQLTIWCCRSWAVPRWDCPERGRPSPLGSCTTGRWAASGRSWRHESSNLRREGGKKSVIDRPSFSLAPVWSRGQKVEPPRATYSIFGFWWRKASDAPWRCFHWHKTPPGPWQGREEATGKEAVSCLGF